MDTVIVACKRKKVLTTELIGDMKYKLSYTPDYDLPTNFKTPYKYAAYNQVGQYRCKKNRGN